MKNVILFSLVACLSSGCALTDSITALNESLDSINESINPVVMIDTSLGGLCSEANSNSSRANQKYEGKGINLSGVINDTLGEKLYNPSILVKSNGVYVHVDSAGIDINKLNNNEKVQVKGTIKSIENNYTGCSLSLSNANITPI